MNEELIQALATATRVACLAISSTGSSTGQAALQASMDQARDTPLEFGWERRAAAHAEFFTTLADAADNQRAAATLNHGAGFAYDLMMTAGRAADGIVINSRRRMLAHLRASDPDQAALEMEKHLAILDFMRRLATSPAKVSA